MSDSQVQNEININNSNKSRLKIFRELCKESKYSEVYSEIYDLIRLSDDIIFKKQCFDYACKNGYKDIAQWIYNNYFMYHSSNEFTEYLKNLAYDVCKNGRLEVFKWMIQIKSDIFNDNYNNYFESASENQHFHILEWICKTAKKQGKTIDINSSFRMAINRSLYQLAKWLLDLSIYDTNKINILLEFAFNSVKQFYDIEIIKLVQLYRPFIYCERENEYIIRNGTLNLRFGARYDTFRALYNNNDITTSQANEINDKNNYRAIEERMYFVPQGSEISLKEAIMRDRFHPKNIEKMIHWGHVDLDC